MSKNGDEEIVRVCQRHAKAWANAGPRNGKTRKKKLYYIAVYNINRNEKIKKNEQKY